MIEHQFRIAELEVANSPRDEKILGLFRFDSSGKVKNSNKLLVIAEISSTLYAYERFLDVVNESVERTRHLIAKVEHDPIARFEKLIQHVNDAVADFLEGEPTPITWGRVSLFLIELSPNHICLTGQGRLMNVFLQKQKDGSYRNFDLLGSLEQPPEVDPKKFFSALICGDMKPGDVLMLGSTNLERLRKELDVKTRLTSLPPVTAALEMKNELEARGIPDDFLAAIISCCALEMPEAVVVEKDDDIDRSTASIRELRETEENTHEKLAPSLVPSPNVKPQKDRLPRRSAKISAGLLGMVSSLKNRVGNLRKKDVAMLTSLRGMNAGHGSVFTEKRKRVAIIALAILVVALAGLLFWKYKGRMEAEAAVWNASFEEATDKRHRAESDLIYANDTRAKQQLEEAEAILASLSADKGDRAERVTTLRGELDGLRERLRKMQSAESVTELVAQGGGNGSLQAPVLVGDTAYVVDRDKGEILKVDLTNNTIKTIPLPHGTENVISGSEGETSIVFATESGNLVAINKQTDAVTALSFTSPHTPVADLVIYAGRAYTLDGTGGQIWRANAITGGFGTGQEYVKASNVSLEGATSMAIDSNIYVLKTDGTVARYLSGGQEGFALTSVDPELKAASALWTDANATRLLVTDPAENRILIFNKDGTLKTQLVSDEFHSLRDLDADETAKRILVIDGARLLLVPMP